MAAKLKIAFGGPDIAENAQARKALMNISNAMSGLSSALKQLNVSSHNVANLQTEDFKGLRARQQESGTGGSRVDVSRASKPGTPSILREHLNSSRALVQGRASIRVIETEVEMLGSLLDIKI